MEKRLGPLRRVHGRGARGALRGRRQRRELEVRDQEQRHREGADRPAEVLEPGVLRGGLALRDVLEEGPQRRVGVGLQRRKAHLSARARRASPADQVSKDPSPLLKGSFSAESTPILTTK